MKGKLSRPYYLIFVCLSLLLSACAREPESRPPSAVGTPPPANIELAAMPTYTPTPLALGSSENPVQIGVVGNLTSPEREAAMLRASAALSNASGYHLQLVRYDTYQDLEQALQQNRAQMAWAQTVEYLLASEKGLLDALLVTNHLGVTAYGVQFVGNSIRGYQNYFDAGTNTSPEPASDALAQLAGLRPCFLSETSLSGFWVPLGYLKQANVSYQDPVFTYSHSASLRAIYIDGICDYAATYAISADPRTSSAVIVDLSDALTRLPVIWISPPVIPNMVLAAQPTLDAVIRNRVSEGLLNYIQDEANRADLSTALSYETAGLEPFTDQGFTELRLLLNSVGLRLSSLLPRN